MEAGWCDGGRVMCKAAVWEVVKGTRGGSVRVGKGDPCTHAQVAGLKACRDLERGKEMHARIVESGGEVAVQVANTLMAMYVRCGSMSDARKVFDSMPTRSAVSWNVMILGYAKREEGELALKLFASMQQQGVAPNDRTFVATLRACSSSLAAVRAQVVVGGEEGVKVEQYLCQGRGIHSQVVDRGLEADMYVGTMLVDVYSKCGSMLDAQHVFDMLPRRDVVSWNPIILGHAEKQEGDVALRCYAQMQQEGVLPNHRTFVAVLKACSSLSALEEGTRVDGRPVKMGCLSKGRAIHSRAAACGFEADAFVQNRVIDMYVKCGSMSDARHVFDKFPPRNVASWNVMILGYAEQGDSEQAFRLYSQMQEQGLAADAWTFVSILKACGRTAALERGVEIHHHIRRMGLEDHAGVILATSLIDMYGRCGSMADAQRVFDALPTKGMVTWNALISGYARHGESGIVFRLLKRMREEEGIRPNGVTYLAILTVCSHAGLLHDGRLYFDEMSEKYGLAPTIEHYTCLLGLLARAGEMEEVVALLDEMPLEPDAVTWMTLLGACRKWTNVEVGRKAFEHVVGLDKHNATAYVLMSNIYADAHMWEERDKVQAMRGNVKAWKEQGKSWWTDTNKRVHTFVVGDTKHPQSQVIYAKLNNLYSNMRQEGYVPDLNCVHWDISDEEKQDSLCGHSERLAIACALINTSPGTPIRIVKNLRVCDDCHKAIAVISKIEGRHITCRDASRFHVYEKGKCSCGDYW